MNNARKFTKDQDAENRKEDQPDKTETQVSNEFAGLEDDRWP